MSHMKTLTYLQSSVKANGIVKPFSEETVVFLVKQLLIPVE